MIYGGSEEIPRIAALWFRLGGFIPHSAATLTHLEHPTFVQLKHSLKTAYVVASCIVTKLLPSYRSFSGKLLWRLWYL